MIGPQDLGGRHGFGAVVPEPDEPLFHAEWEKRVLAMTLAMGASGLWSIDESRHARESLPPADYLSFSNYRIWFEALTALLEEHGLIAKSAPDTGKDDSPAKPLDRVLTADAVPGVLAAGSPADRDALAPAAFGIGDRVVTRLGAPPTHTRLPAYARGRPGAVHAVHGVHVFPDSNAHRLGEAPCWLYNIRFEARDLWGTDTTAGAIYIDLWEPYLERV